MPAEKTITIEEIVAKKIDLVRNQKNYSVRELSEKSGIAISAISNIIRCKKIPSIYTISCICNALEVSLSDFFNQDEQVLMLRGKESILIKIYRELSPMSQDTLIKVSKCMK